MNIGDTLKINGVDLVVLDFVGDNPLVWAYNLDVEIEFSKYSNDYKTSTLKEKIESWFENTGIQAIERKIDLTTMDMNNDYGKIRTKVAPFTFDEYRKYNKIIKKYVKNRFWTATAWSNGSWGSNFVCFICSDGGMSYNGCGYTSGLAPVFIIDNDSNNSLEFFFIEELAKQNC